MGFPMVSQMVPVSTIAQRPMLDDHRGSSAAGLVDTPYLPLCLHKICSKNLVWRRVICRPNKDGAGGPEQRS